MILVSFSSTVDALSNDVKNMAFFARNVLKIRRSAFWGTPGIVMKTLKHICSLRISSRMCIGQVLGADPGLLKGGGGMCTKSLTAGVQGTGSKGGGTGGGGRGGHVPQKNFQHPKSALFSKWKVPFFLSKKCPFKVKHAPFCWGKWHFPQYLSP